jgi:RimJ/RimL family protein N-acetyltransferase
VFRGKLVALRARHESDVAILHAELYEDVVTRSMGDSRPWYPIPAGPASPFAVTAAGTEAAFFSVEGLDTGELAGEALLWGIDSHNRCAHLGLALRPGFRGRGFGTEVVALLSDYGFSTLGLNRLQIEAASSNAAMIAAATANGYRPEGLLRQASWANGRFVDSAIYGALAADRR